MQIRADIMELNTLDEADAFHCRLANAVGEALAMSTDAAFGAAKAGLKQKSSIA